MPTIICSYCEYVGQGDAFEERISDVECHEEFCDTRLADEEASKIDAAYEQAKDNELIDFSQSPPKLTI